MSIKDSIVESRQQVTLENGSAVICWIKDLDRIRPDDIDFDPEPVSQREFGQRFGTGIRTIGRYLRNLF